MNGRNLFILVVLCASVIITGCKKDDDPVKPVVTGTINGSVKLYNYYGAQSANAANVIVTASEANLSDTTDANGRWEIKNLPAGTYTITFTRWGCGAWKVYGYKYDADVTKTLDTVALSQTPSYTIYNLNKMVTPASPDEVDLIGMFTGTDMPTGTKYIRLFIGANADVSSLPSKHAFSVRTASTTKDYAAVVKSNTFINNGFASGAKVYIAAYTESVLSTSYIDPATGKYWYPNISSASSNKLEVTVP